MSQTSRIIGDLNTTLLPKALRRWVYGFPLLYIILFPPFLVDVRHNHSHLVTQHRRQKSACGFSDELTTVTPLFCPISFGHKIPTVYKRQV